VAVGSQNLSLAKIPFAHNLLIFGENNEVACWSSFRVSFGLFRLLASGHQAIAVENLALGCNWPHSRGSGKGPC